MPEKEESDEEPDPDAEPPEEDALDWDLAERDALLEDGTLEAEIEPPTTVIVEADE